MKKRIFILFLLSIFISFSLLALSKETIAFADLSLLKEMAKARGIDNELSENELRSELYSYYGYSEAVVEEKEENKAPEESYKINILEADRVDSSSNYLTLNGNVVIEFITNEDEKKTLSSSIVLVDIDKKKLTALGEAKYVDSSENAPIGEITADVLTVKWQDKDIIITNGTTQTERKNSEDKKVEFFTSGEKLTYLEEGAIIFDDGSITSNRENGYSSISASTIAILPGEDMFLSSATLNIGRVPILYLPFFFFPGSKIVGNPSFGFSSDKGAFLNTTFELFGTYPKLSEQDEESSFSSLLKSEDSSKERVRNGYYYTQEEEEKTAFKSWVDESESYMALLFDSYKGGSTNLNSGALHFGLDSTINIGKKNLVLSLLMGVATPLSVNDKKLRYYGINSLSLSLFGVKAYLSLPFYSDRTVLKDFLNRVTSFSYGPLMGSKTTFPDDYSSSITSFKREFNLSFSLPSFLNLPFVTSFNLRKISLESKYSITQDNETVIDSYTLPTLSLSLSGDIFSLESNKEEEREKEDEEKSENEKEEEKLLLALPYEEKNKANIKTYDRSNLKLSYSLTEDLSNNIYFTDKGEKDNKNYSVSTYYKFVLSGKLSSFISFSNSFSTSISYYERENYLKSSSQSKTTHNPYNSFKLSLSKLGLEYTLAIKPYKYTVEESGLEKKIESGEFSFTKEYVKGHSIDYIKSFDSILGEFTPSVSYTLFPLDETLKPSLKWSKGNFSSTLSLLFKSKDGKLNKDLLSFDFSYKSTHFILTNKVLYKTNLISSLGAIKPLSANLLLKVQTENKKWAIEEALSFSGLSEDFIKSSTTTIYLPQTSFIVESRIDKSKLVFDSLTFKSDIKGLSFSLWKGRVFCSFSLKSNLYIDYNNKNKSYLRVSPEIVFSIAEFIDIKFSFTTQNTKLSKYYDENNIFSLSLFGKDLLRSVDFITDGRKNTSFILQSSSLEIVHYMQDWNLTVKYFTSYKKNNVNGKTIYSLTPSFSIYLSWITMPDLKVEENWEREGEGSQIEWKRK